MYIDLWERISPNDDLDWVFDGEEYVTPAWHKQNGGNWPENTVRDTIPPFVPISTECAHGNCQQAVFSGEMCSYHTKLDKGLLHHPDTIVW
jgi:hypothetical protein